jgi:hypothetical protein
MPGVATKEFPGSPQGIGPAPHNGKTINIPHTGVLFHIYFYGFQSG